MNETQELPPEAFEPARARSIADMTRTSEDKLVAGVCGGAARHLGVDPVVLRVVLAVLTFVGFAGPILYTGAWFLLRRDDTDRSPVARLLGLGDNEPQVRTAGLIVTAVLAGVAVLGDGSWGWGPWPALGALFWLGLPVALLYWLLVVRRRPDPAVAGAAAPARERRPFSWALTLLTLSVGTIVLAVTYLATLDAPLDATSYLAIALGVTAAGVLLGVVVGDATPLVLLGLGLAGALVVASFVPSPRMGEQRVAPQSASELRSEYRHGVGLVRLDLTGVDPDTLLGRTVRVTNGLGQVLVIVPPGLPVDVDARVRAGEVDALGRRESGTMVSLDRRAPEPGSVLTLQLEGTLGQVRVEER